MRGVTKAKYLSGHVLEIEFDNGVRKRVDFAEHLKGEVFAPLRDLARFRKFRVDPLLETLTWDTGADFCADVLYNGFADADSGSPLDAAVVHRISTRRVRSGK